VVVAASCPSLGAASALSLFFFNCEIGGGLCPGRPKGIRTFCLNSDTDLPPTAVGLFFTADEIFTLAEANFFCSSAMEDPVAYNANKSEPKC